jgi:hypothetical protein
MDRSRTYLRDRTDPSCPKCKIVTEMRLLGYAGITNRRGPVRRLPRRCDRALRGLGWIRVAAYRVAAGCRSVWYSPRCEWAGLSQGASASMPPWRGRTSMRSKVHLACGPDPIPLSIVITAGQRGDSPKFQADLEGIRYPGQARGTPGAAQQGPGPLRQAGRPLLGHRPHRRDQRAAPTALMKHA